MRANTQKRTTRGAGDKRGRREKEKSMRNRDMRRSVEGRGMGVGNTGETRWAGYIIIVCCSFQYRPRWAGYTAGTFRKEIREFEGGGFGVD